MRFYSVLGTLLLVQLVNGDNKPEVKKTKQNGPIAKIKKGGSFLKETAKSVPISVRNEVSGKSREDLQTSGLRDPRQARYFETLADDFVDKEKSAGEAGYAVDKLNLGQVIENEVDLMEPLDRQDRHLNNSFVEAESLDDRILTNRGKFGLHTKGNLISPYGGSRQERNVFFTDVNSVTEINQKNANSSIINFLRGGRTNETRSETPFKIMPGFQLNEQYPVNDDVADFANYMKNKKSRKPKSRLSSWSSDLGLIDEDIMQSDQLGGLDNGDDYKVGEADKGWYQNDEGVAGEGYLGGTAIGGKYEDKLAYIDGSLNGEKGTRNIHLKGPSEKSDDWSSLIPSRMNEREETLDNLALLTNQEWESATSQPQGGQSTDVSSRPGISLMSQGVVSQGVNAINLGGTSQGASSQGATSQGAASQGAASQGAASQGPMNQGQSDSQEIPAVHKRPMDLSTASVVRDRVINLPEPLVFNSSHVVSSFVYSMIPFRSPLLNLLESDKQSKYIMIKVDPILQRASEVIKVDEVARNVDTALERNIMQFIGKSLGSENDFIEGSARSKASKLKSKPRKEEDIKNDIAKGDQYVHYFFPKEIKY